MPSFQYQVVILGGDERPAELLLARARYAALGIASFRAALECFPHSTIVLRTKDRVIARSQRAGGC